MTTKTTYDRCGTCGKYGFLAHHLCPPAWTVCPEDAEEEHWADLDDEAKPNAYSHYPDDAATSWVDRYETESGEASIAYSNGDESMSVVVWNTKLLNEVKGLMYELQKIVESLANPDEGDDPDRLRSRRDDIDSQIEGLKVSGRNVYKVFGELTTRYFIGN